MSQSCDGTVYGDGSNSILNSVHCADQMLGEFVDHIRSSPAVDDTIIVLASDHLAMPNKAWDQLTSIDRNNLLLFLGKDISPENNNRPGSTLDVGPTLLSLAGADVEKFGFGRSLLSHTPTLSQSLSSIDERMDAYSGFLVSLWSFPDIDSGIRLDGRSERLIMGNQSIGYLLAKLT